MPCAEVTNEPDSEIALGESDSSTIESTVKSLLKIYATESSRVEKRPQAETPSNREQTRNVIPLEH